MVTQPPCILWAEKLALRREDLSPADCLALDAHLAICSACRQTQADYHLLSTALKALPPPVIRPFPRLILDDQNTYSKTNHFSSAKPIHRVLPTMTLSKNGARRRAPRKIALLAAIACLLAVLLPGGLLLRATLMTNTSHGGTTLLTYRQHTDFVSTVAWSPDGQKIASGSWDHTVQVWDAHSGEPILTCANSSGQNFARHSDFVSAVAWSPKGNLIASGSWDHTVQIRNAHTCKLLSTYSGHNSEISSLSWSPDGTSIASTSWDHTLQVWNVFTGKPLYVYPTEMFTDFVNAVAWSPDGFSIVAGGNSRFVYVLDVRTGKVLRRYTTSLNSSYPYPVDALAWSPDSKLVAVGQRDHMVHIWDVSKNDDIILSYTGHQGDISALAWSPDGKRVASGSFDHTVQVWEAYNGEHLLTYTGHSEAIASVSWSPDNKKIVSGSWDNTARIWEAPPGP